MQTEAPENSSFSKRSSFVDGCMWFLYVGILLPTLGGVGILAIFPPAGSEIVFVPVGVAVLGFTAIRLTQLSIKLVKKLMK